jgi:hypothetical protein
MYSGAFRGSVRAFNQELLNIAGDLSAELVLDPSGATLVLRDAGVTIMDRNDNRLTVSLSGSIDCSSGRLEQGLIDGSLYHSDSRRSYSFSGAIDGAYTPDPAGVNGSWSGESDDIALIDAQGTWSLRLNE